MDFVRGRYLGHPAKYAVALRDQLKLDKFCNFYFDRIRGEVRNSDSAIDHRYDSNNDSDGVGDGSGDWMILPEPELRLGKDVLVPDIAGWRANKYQLNWANSFSEVVPNWVCEVLSPTTRHIDLGRKSDIYAREGVSHLWIVDPKARTLQVSELSAGKWHPISTLTDAERVTVPPFEKLNISLSRLWLTGPCGGFTVEAG